MGRVFDQKSFKLLTLGTDDIIKGLDIGVTSMKLHEKALLTISSDYGFGDVGSQGIIPGKAALIYEVELLNFMIN